MTSKPTKNQPTPPPDQLTANEENETSKTSEKAKAATTNQASQPAKADPKTTPKTEAKTEPKKKKPWSAPVLQFLDEEEETEGHSTRQDAPKTYPNQAESVYYTPDGAKRSDSFSPS